MAPLERQFLKEIRLLVLAARDCKLEEQERLEEELLLQLELKHEVWSFGCRDLRRCRQVFLAVGAHARDLELLVRHAEKFHQEQMSQSSLTSHKMSTKTTISRGKQHFLNLGAHISQRGCRF